MDATARLHLRARRRQDHFEEVVLPELPEVPGQIGLAEARYLYWLTSRTYTGRGAVVELGSWLGRSAVHLAAGIRDSGATGRFVCVDRFSWDEKQEVPGFELAPGQDTRPIFLEHVAPILPGVETIAADVRRVKWDGTPIEILFVDVAKSSAGFSRVLETFAPHLLPGTGFLASQDYGYVFAYAQVLALERLVPLLEPVHLVGATAGFVVAERLPSGAALLRRIDLETLPLDEAEQSWERAMGRILAPGLRRRLEPGFCLWLHERGATDAALARLARLSFPPRMRRLWQGYATKAERFAKYEPIFRALGFDGTA